MGAAGGFSSCSHSGRLVSRPGGLPPCMLLPRASGLAGLGVTTKPCSDTAAGTVLEALLAWAVLPGLGWRWLLALSALPLGLLLALYPLLPESPHWLVAQHRYAEAEAVLQRVAAANGRKRPLLLRLAPGSPGRPAGESERQQGPITSGYGGVRSRPPALAASPGVQAPLLAAAAPAGAGLAPAGGRPQEGAEQQHHPQQQRPGHRRDDSGSFSSQQRKAVWRTMMAAFAAVFSPQLRRTTLLLYGIWSVNALTYCECAGAAGWTSGAPAPAADASC